MIKLTPTGYPRLVMPDDPIELEAMFGPEHATPREQVALDSYRDPIARAAFLLVVRCLAHLGYVPDLTTLAPGILAYVGDQYAAVIPPRYFRDRRARRSDMLTVARPILGYQRWTARHAQDLRPVLQQLALDYPRESDLMTAAVERLREWHVELPEEDTLLTLVESALHQVEDATYAEVMQQATTTLQQTLQTLLDHPEDQDTLLAMIKQPAGKASVKSMRREAEKLAALAALNIPDTALSSISQRKIVFLAEQANRYTAADLRALSDQRRTLILVAFVIYRRQQGRDIMVEQLDKIVRRLSRTSATTEEDAAIKREKKTPYPRRLSTKVLSIIALAPPGTVEERLFALMPQADYRRIYTTVSGEEEQFAKQTARATMLRRFRNHYRQILPLILAHVPIEATAAAGKEIVDTVDLLKQITKRPQTLTLPTRPTFLDATWDAETVVHAPAAAPVPPAPAPIRVKRHPLELQTLIALQEALRSGTVWVSGSERYGNLADHLVPWDAPARVDFYAKHHFPETATAFTAKLTTLMHEALGDLDRATKRGRAVSLKDDRWVVPKITETPIPKHIQKLEAKVIAELGYPPITTLLADSDVTLGLSESFLHYADKQTHVTKDKRRDIIATLFCDATNIGPTKMALSTPGLSAGTILWTQRWYTYIENLRQGIIRCNNYVNRSPLAKYWGDGTTVSFDGMQLSTYDNNTRAELHLRYQRGNGGLFLQHVTNKLTGLYGQFTRCSSPEAAHILVGLLNHRTDLDIDTADTDGIGDNTLVLGLGWLLGFTIRPRIKRIKYVKLVRPSKTASYPTIDGMFSRTLNTALIEEHYDEVVQLVCSIAERTISPDVVIKRFTSYSRKSGLHQALIEIGRAVECIFHARFLEDPKLRRENHRNLCRGEAWNGMTRQIFSFNRAIMRENNVEEQERLALSLLLVQNLIVVWNVSHMSRAIASLKQQGYKFDSSDFQHMTPLMTHHIRMIPDFILKPNHGMDMNPLIAQKL
jgi:TnpA family transposase